MSGVAGDLGGGLNIYFIFFLGTCIIYISVSEIENDDNWLVWCFVLGLLEYSQYVVWGSRFLVNSIDGVHTVVLCYVVVTFLLSLSTYDGSIELLYSYSPTRGRYHDALFIHWKE